MKKNNFNITFIAESGVIAALYIALTGIFAPIEFGPVQVRISEALCAAALFRASAVPGMTIGCLISNLLWSPFGLLDVALGTLATFIGVFLTYCLRRTNRFIALAPPIISNALLVPVVLLVSTKTAYLYGFATVLAGQLVACYGLGFTLARGLERTPFGKKV